MNFLRVVTKSNDFFPVSIQSLDEVLKESSLAQGKNLEESVCKRGKRDMIVLTREKLKH